MSELQLIKEEIYNLGLVKPLLESMGCESVRENGGRMEGTRPGGDNNRAFSVYLDENLAAKVWTKNVKTSDIFDLVSYFKYGKTSESEIRKCLPNSKNYIISTLKLKDFSVSQTKDIPDYNFHLREFQKRKTEKFEPNPVLDEAIMEEFIPTGHIKWFEEDSISIETQERFEVGFDVQTERIIYPVRNRLGELVGVRGRATREEDEKRTKYFPIYSFSKSKELFNLHRALPYIQKFKKVIVFESEKSTLLADQYGVRNTVAIMGSDLSDVQANMLKAIVPNVVIISAFDKDKKKDDVLEMLMNIRGYDHLYSIFDTKDYLDEKDSPIDKGKEVWETLYKKHCYKIPNK